MDYQLLSSILFIVLTIFMIAKNSLSFSPIRFHCPNYILNTYLYTFLSIAILLTTILSIKKINISLEQLFTGPGRFLLLFLSIIMIVAVMTVSPQYFFTKHIIWVLYLVLMGTILYPIYDTYKESFTHSAITTAAIMVFLSTIAFMKPELISLSWSNILLMLTISLLITNISERMLAYNSVIDSQKYNKMISYGAIMLFSFWVLYDTKRVIVNADNCVNPDYINQSLDFVLDSLNIFTNLINIKE
jgi:FtsH-binding integral membrane protein